MPQASRTPLPFSEISHPQARLPREPTLFQLKPPGQHTYPSWGGAPPSVITHHHAWGRPEPDMATLWALTSSVNLAGSTGLGRARTTAVRKSLKSEVLDGAEAELPADTGLGAWSLAEFLTWSTATAGKGPPRWRAPRAQGRARSEAGHVGGEGTGQAQPRLPS